MNENNILCLITAVTLFSLASVLSPLTALADGFQHQGDRYVINVDELDLSGDETLYDLLLMCPDLLVDGSGAIVSSNLLGNWSLRIDNFEILMDQATSLMQLKASDIQQVKICNYPAAMKGIGGLNSVIDLKLKRKDKGECGKIALDGDSYGEAGGYTHAFVQRDNMLLLVAGQGSWGRAKQGGGISHVGQGDAYAALNWDITPKDNLVVMLGQQYNGEGAVSAPYDFDHKASVEVAYTHALGDNGACLLLQARGDYYTSRYSGDKTHSTSPYALAEFGFPIFKRVVYVTAGIEAGYAGLQQADSDFPDKSCYEDIYVQADWSVGNFTFSVGERFRVMTYWLKTYSDTDYWDHTRTDHDYHVAAMYKFDKSHTIKGTFARRFYDPIESDFIDESLLETSMQPYTSDFADYKAYQSELNYSYSAKDFIIGAQVKNVSQDIIDGHDNTLSAGATGWFHKGLFRASAGVHYYHQKSKFDGGLSEYKNYVVVKLAPSFDLPAGFRLSSTMLYSSKKLYNYSWTAYNGEFNEYRSNFYASLTLEKKLGRHWDIKGIFHNIADQRLGRRGATISVIYYWGGRI